LIGLPERPTVLAKADPPMTEDVAVLLDDICKRYEVSGVKESSIECIGECAKTLPAFYR